MKELNLAEILQDCPQGTKLYSPMCGECTLDSVDDCPKYPITVRSSFDRLPYYLTANGRYLDAVDAECVLFPSKDQRDWSKFQRPFRDGDIVVSRIGKPFILKFYDYNVHSYCGVDSNNVFHLSSSNWTVADGIRHADEEEKQTLLATIKDNGYKWNAKTKTLEKFVEPKFKVGDKVRNKNNHNVVFTITSIEEDSYVCGAKTAFWISDQDNYELVPNKFDISTLKPCDSRVLARNYEDEKWFPVFWGFYGDDDLECPYNCSGFYYAQCIPLEGNEHLIGTTDDCDEYYKTWED